MSTLRLTEGQRDYLIDVIRNLSCSVNSEDLQAQTIPEGFPQADPENEVIFDPENEVIFDPESEVIFDPYQVFNPEDGCQHTAIFNNIYDSYGHKINLQDSLYDFVKLLYWLFKWKENSAEEDTTGLG